MRRAMFAAVAGLLLGTVCAASDAFAKGEACRAEMDKFCKDVEPGEGRIIKCLREHDADLSDKCRAYVNTASQYMACIDDAVRLCPHTQPGGARVLACLRTRMSDLSSQCKRELARLRP
jgi:hypothetical protein